MISFRRVNESDFVLMFNWLQLPHVKKYWHAENDFSLEETSEKYRVRLEDDHYRMYIIQLDNIDIGFIQSSSIGNRHPFKVSEPIVGLDIYIGNIKYFHKNYGKDIIRRFIKEYVFNDPEIHYVGIDPEIKNRNAIRAYKKAGFHHVNTEYSLEMKKMTYYMVLRRD